MRCVGVDVTIISSASLISAKPMLCFKSADQNNWLSLLSLWTGGAVGNNNLNIELKTLLPSINNSLIYLFYLSTKLFKIKC